jgi:hypothetical protein
MLYNTDIMSDIFDRDNNHGRMNNDSVEPQQRESRVRRAVGITVAGAMAVGAVWLGLSSRGASASNPCHEVTTEYVVSPNETEWDIADELTPGDADPRPMEHKIDRLNPGKHLGDLATGEHILVPQEVCNA